MATRLPPGEAAKPFDYLESGAIIAPGRASKPPLADELQALLGLPHGLAEDLAFRTPAAHAQRLDAGAPPAPASALALEEPRRRPGVAVLVVGVAGEVVEVVDPEVVVANARPLAAPGVRDEQECRAEVGIDERAFEAVHLGLTAHGLGDHFGAGGQPQVPAEVVELGAPGPLAVLGHQRVAAVVVVLE